MQQPLLEMKHIRKTFSSTVALGDVSLNVYPGEVRGLIGENGSGKSTISSIAAGMQKPDSGEMIFQGSKWNPKDMIDALDKGFGMIVQESGTIAGITVAENIFLGDIDEFCSLGGKGPVNAKKLNRAANDALDSVGVKNVRGNMPMASLDFQTRKLVEITKVVIKNPAVLVVDETTTALSQEGRKILYDIIKKQKEHGHAVLFISHDLDEIMEVCDTLTVLRDGVIIRDFTKEEFDPDDIRASMIGRELKGDYYRSDYTPTKRHEVALEAMGITLEGALNKISFKVHKGEIVGIGGLSDCGMHTLGKVLFGAVKPDKGMVVTMDNTHIRSETTAMKKGIGYVAKDRDTESLCLSASIKDNIAIAGMNEYAVGKFFILDGREKKYVDEQIAALSIKCSDRNQPVAQLSGGNKQKVVFGKWIGCNSEILILDCPTRGVDIGVKSAMYQLMVKLKNEGKSIIMISEELPELIGMCDRILIMRDGEIKNEFERSETLSDADIIYSMI